MHRGQAGAAMLHTYTSIALARGLGLITDEGVNVGNFFNDLGSWLTWEGQKRKEKSSQRRLWGVQENQHSALSRTKTKYREDGEWEAGSTHN